MAKKTNSSNSNLHSAKSEKNDEFYTQLGDIENELRHYRDHFRNKVVFCNCDDPDFSNFYKHFMLNFEFLGLKKLITTHYEKDSQSYALVIDKASNKNGNGFLLPYKIDLKGDGDFRSEESIAFLKEADIVVTNPPFSLFREYVAQLFEHNKKFLIIGNKNAITYKEIFKLIKENECWLGYESPSKFANKDGKITNQVQGLCRWFTNLTHKKRNEILETIAKYDPNAYPKYDNYDAIEVSKVKDIPLDYDGAMGVPITFLDKYNPDQFEIIKFRKGDDEKDLAINGKTPYFRILIKNKKL